MLDKKVLIALLRLLLKNEFGTPGAKITAEKERTLALLPELSTDFIPQLIQKCNDYQIGMVGYAFENKDLINLLDQIGNAILLFENTSNGLKPWVILRKNKTVKSYCYSNGNMVEQDLSTLLTQKIVTVKDALALNLQLPLQSYHLEHQNNIIAISIFNLSPSFSATDQHLTPFQRLVKMLSVEKKDIINIYIYSILVGLLSLGLPLGIQAIVSFVSGGVIFNSVTLLITLVIIGFVLSGGVQLMQITMVELLQRRLFTRTAYEFALKIPKINTASLLKFYPPELMNRFFDILTVQKALPKLLIDITSNALQIIFGLLLISFYHPFFVFYSLVLMVLLWISFRLVFHKGLESSLKESKYKYKIVQWFEDMARSITSIKIMGFSTLPIDRTDDLLNGYLYARKKHFKVLLNHYTALVAFKTLIIGGLLIIGSQLVVNREISLGQFVASEIVIILILGAIEKLILSIDVIYDTLTAVEKIATVTDLPNEKDTLIPLPVAIAPVKLEIKNLSFQFEDANKPTLNDISFVVEKGEKICIAGTNNAGKHTLVRLITGLLEGFKGSIQLNGVALNNMSIADLRELVAYNGRTTELFEGTLEQNITLGKLDITTARIIQAIHMAGLTRWFDQLPDGLSFPISSEGQGLSKSLCRRIMLARAIADSPKLLILEDFLSHLDHADKRQILDNLDTKINEWTLLGVTNDINYMKICDKIIVLDRGSISFNGTYSEFIQTALYQQFTY